MQKINGQTHRRFITALESMIRDMDDFGHTATADELVVSRCELEDVYSRYNQKIEELNHLIGDYYELFEEKHSGYLHASRIRQKELTRIRRKKMEKNNHIMR